MSESHHRQMKLFCEDGGKFISSFSSEFLKGYLDILRRQFGGKRVHSNVVYQEYIKDKEHIHMNSTKWHTLTGLCMWLGKQGICKVDETEKGWFVEYIDRDPEKIKRQESNDRLEKTEDEINRQFLEQQIKHNKSKETQESPIYTPFVRPDTQEIVRLDFNLGSKRPSGDLESTFTEEVQDTTFNTPTTSNTLSLPVKKGKLANPLMLADQKAREEKSKSNDEKIKLTKPSSNTSHFDVRRRALDELIEKEEAFKDKKNRKDYWMIEGIEVKLINRKLPSEFRLKHATVIKLLDNYTAVVKVVDSSTRIKVDQDHVQTIVPEVSSTVMVVNGTYRGEYATLQSVDRKESECNITLATGLCMGRLVKHVSLDDICKLSEIKR